MDSNDLEACGMKCCYFWFLSEVKFLTRFWRLFGLSHFAYFYAILIDFYAVKSFVTAWIVAVAWIVAGDNSCRCSRHKSSPATIHAVCVSMNCRRRQFMPEISLMLCTRPATIRAAWKNIIGIYCRRRHILTPSQPMFIYNFFYLLIAFFIWLRFKLIFLRYSSYTILSNKNHSQY